MPVPVLPDELWLLQREAGNQAVASAVTHTRSAGERYGAAAGPATLVYFGKGDHDLRHREQQALERILVIASDPQCMVLLAGHASTEGPERLNQELSEKRADAVAGFLVQHGVPRRRIQVTAFGKRMPSVSERAEKGEDVEGLRSQNRRVEVTFQRPGGPSRRLADLQARVNKTMDRLRTNLATDEHNLEVARRNLTRIMARVAWSAIVRADAELWVADAERNAEGSRKLLDELKAAAGDPVKAAVYFRRSRGIPWMIDRKLHFLAQKARLLERAKAERANARTEQERDAYDELIDFYRRNIQASRLEIHELQADLAFGEP